jgi:hypothetical protein
VDKQAPSGFPFADRVAEVFDGDEFAGHLLVTVPEVVSTGGRGGITYVDLDFARPDPEEPSAAGVVRLVRPPLTVRTPAAAHRTGGGRAG